MIVSMSLGTFKSMQRGISIFVLINDRVVKVWAGNGKMHEVEVLIR